MSNERYIVGIGAANMDICGRSFADIREMDSNPGQVSMSAGGVSRNILENYALLSGKSYLLTCVGKDVLGSKIIESAHVFVNTDHIRKVDHHSSCYVSILNDRGEMYCAVSDMSIMSYLDVDYIRKNDYIIKGAQLIVCDPSIPSEVMDYILKTYTVPVFLDPVSRFYASRVTDRLSSFHSIKANELEAEILSGIRINDEQDMIEAAGIILAKGVKRIFITRGERGCYYDDGVNRLFYKLPLKARIVNVNGAGDAFMAMLVYCYMNDIEFPETLKMASTASLLALESSATVNPKMSLERVCQLIQEI